MYVINQHYLSGRHAGLGQRPDPQAPSGRIAIATTLFSRSCMQNLQHHRFAGIWAGKSLDSRSQGGGGGGGGGEETKKRPQELTARVSPPCVRDLNSEN